MPKQPVAILAAASVLGLVCASAANARQTVDATPAEVLAWPGDSRADLLIPTQTWSGIEAFAGFDGPIGYSRDQMANYGRDAHLLESTIRLFGDARAITRETGRVSDRILTGARRFRLGDLTQEAYALLDVAAARGVRAPEPGSWGVAYIQRDASPTEALEAIGARFADPTLTETPPILDDQTRPLWSELPLPVQRLVVRMLIADAEARRWIRSAIDPELIRAAAIEQLRLAGVDGRTLAGATYSFSDALAGAQELWRADPSGIGLDARPTPAARALLEGYDASMMAYASVVYARHASAAIDEFEAWRAQARWRPDERRPLRGLAFDTPLGPVRILSSEADRLAVGMEVPLDEVARLGTLSARDGAILVVDLGGDDSYFGRVGTPNLAGVVAGNGEGLLRPIATIIDLDGNDMYDAAGLDGSIACGLFGIGAIFDLGGNDRYLGASHSVARALYGTALLVDRSGTDQYVTSGFHTQGTAHCGVALLLDQSGNDKYTLDAFGQGLGGTRGAGLLIDLDGNDQYRARDNGWNLPTYRDLSASYAQGVGYGRRADFGDGHSLAGGWGMLLDNAGDDSYHATVWSQGAGYWWGVGVFEDRAGDDSYRNGWHSLGAAAHFSIGHAVDLEGSDQYNLDNPSTVGQYMGSARDGSIAMFIDGDGNDRAVLSNRSAGCADLGSIAIYWDRRGNDRYTIKLDTTANSDRALGEVIAYDDFRSFRDDLISLGLFLDTEGRDEYRPTSPQIVDRNSWDRSASPNERALGIDEERYEPEGFKRDAPASDAQE